MSSVARWCYTNKATVWPLVSLDKMMGGATWGAPYQIACTWTAGSKIVTDANGAEFVSTCEYFHEDKRVRHGDYIARGVHSGPDPIDVVGALAIQSHTDWDMSFFGKKDAAFPDFRSVV